MFDDNCYNLKLAQVLGLMVNTQCVPLSVFSHCMPRVSDSSYLSHSLFLLSNINGNHLSDPVPMVAVVGVTLSLLILFLALVLALLVAYKKEKMCFKGEITFQSVFPEKSWDFTVGTTIIYPIQG